MKNFKAQKINLAESYNRLFGNTKRQLLEYARDTKDGQDNQNKFFILKALLTIKLLNEQTVTIPPVYSTW